MMLKPFVMTFRFIAAQGTEDLYRCVETGRMYVRQHCNDEYVRWLSSIKWQGGYEADCPLKEGICICVVDKNDDVLFEEYITKVDGYMDTVAEKVGPFSNEVPMAFALEIAERSNLTLYDDWKNWLLNEAQAVGYTGYYDNWLYDAEYGEYEKIEKREFLGMTVYAVKQKAKHRKCGKIWTDYEIRSADLSTCLAICGYAIEKEE